MPGLFVEQPHGKAIPSLEHGVLLLHPPNSLCCNQMTMFQDEHTNRAHMAISFFFKRSTLPLD